MTLALGLLNYRGFYPYQIKTGVNSSSQVKLLQLYIQFLLLSKIAHLQASRTRALCQWEPREEGNLILSLRVLVLKQLCNSMKDYGRKSLCQGALLNWMVREQGSPSNFLSPAMGISHDSRHFSLSRTMRVASTARVNHSFSFTVSYLNKCKESHEGSHSLWGSRRELGCIP